MASANQCISMFVEALLGIPPGLAPPYPWWRRGNEHHRSKLSSYYFAADLPATLCSRTLTSPFNP